VDAGDAQRYIDERIATQPGCHKNQCRYP